MLRLDQHINGLLPNFLYDKQLLEIFFPLTGITQTTFFYFYYFLQIFHKLNFLSLIALLYLMSCGYAAYKTIGFIKI